ncbi:MAG: OmpA family protein [Deltaproteobacteria bacterium]|nr:OmpA family protein [Deltaproteobacteria bacterium]
MRGSNKLVLLLTLGFCVGLLSFGCAGTKQLTSQEVVPSGVTFSTVPIEVEQPVVAEAKEGAVPVTLEKAQTQQQAVEQSLAKQPVAKQPPVVAITTFTNIHFALDEAVISAGDQLLLQKYAEVFKAVGIKGVIVEGHCDERGSAEYNLALGQRRAEAVANYLQALGVAKEKLSTVSYGIERPLEKASTEEAWSKNRRAQFVVK